MPIRYTPGQFRLALGLTKETLRYWKNELSPLRASSGHSPCFTSGDLLATAVCKVAAEKAGIPVSRFTPFAVDLFEQCRKGSWPQLERTVAVFDFGANSVRLAKDSHTPQPSECSLLVPLRGIIEELRERLLVEGQPEQSSLALSPVPLSTGARK
jgi:hypothetical protein